MLTSYRNISATAEMREGNGSMADLLKFISNRVVLLNSCWMDQQPREQTGSFTNTCRLTGIQVSPRVPQCRVLSSPPGDSDHAKAYRSTEVEYDKNKSCLPSTVNTL